MFCPTCGARCPDNAIACQSCGSVLPGLTGALGGRVPAGPGDPVPLGTLPSPDGPVVSGETILSAEDPSGSAPGGAARRASDLSLSPRVGQTKLVVEQGRILGEQFLLNDHEVIIGRYDANTGRCPDIDLTAQDPAYVHRQHVRLRFDRSGDRLVMQDMGGRNGSYLNNQLIEKNATAIVQLGDKIRIGRVVLRVQSVRDTEDPRDAR